MLSAVEIPALPHAQLQSDIKAMSKRDAVKYLAATYPNQSERWFCRNLAHIQSLNPERLHDLIFHSDPTARTAINNVMKEQAA